MMLNGKVNASFPLDFSDFAPLDVYPMDFYRKDGGRWANYAAENRARQVE